MKKILILGILVIAAISIFLAGNQAKAYLPGNLICVYTHNGLKYDERFVFNSCPNVTYEYHVPGGESVAAIKARGENHHVKDHDPSSCVLARQETRTDL